jgi:hypothetical protein
VCVCVCVCVCLWREDSQAAPLGPGSFPRGVFGSSGPHHKLMSAEGSFLNLQGTGMALEEVWMTGKRQAGLGRAIPHTS